MLDGSGLEIFVSPKQITSHRILSYVRAMQNATGSNVETLYRMADEQVEALEIPGAAHLPVRRHPAEEDVHPLGHSDWGHHPQGAVHHTRRR